MAINRKLLFVLSLFLLSASHQAFGNEDIKQQEGQQQQQQQQQDTNPFVFRQQQNFKSQVRNQEGNIRVLQRFSKRSNLLRGLENYRLAIFESNPNTFTIPNHWDADTVSIVLNGRGSVSLIEENDKVFQNLERGDIFRIRAGTSVYFVNRDNNEKLQIAKLVQPVSTIPGKFRPFTEAGGRDPESIYNSFSDGILEAAFNVPSSKIQRLFQGQNKGAFVKASRQQIEALTRHSSTRRGRQSQGTFNLFNQRPEQSNEFGKLYQADQNDFKQLQDLDVAVSFANITHGAMEGPFYNSRATKIALVVDGSGYVEIVSPYTSQGQQSRQQQQGEQSRQEQEGEQRRQEQQQQGQQGKQEQEGQPGRQGEQQGRQGRQEQGGQPGRQGSQQQEKKLQGRQGSQEQQGQQGQQGRQQRASPTYNKVSARLSRGDVFVVPAGHPVVVIASGNHNLQVLCFEINAENNQKNQLAGKNNILRQLEREAKELSFNIPASQVDEILQKQDKSWFFPGPHQRQGQEDRGNAYN